MFISWLYQHRICTNYQNNGAMVYTVLIWNNMKQWNKKIDLIFCRFPRFWRIASYTFIILQSINFGVYNRVPTRFWQCSTHSNFIISILINNNIYNIYSIHHFVNFFVMLFTVIRFGMFIRVLRFWIPA